MITCTDFKGYTPLHLAADRGYGELVKLLLDNGADRQAKASLHLMLRPRLTRRTKTTRHHCNWQPYQDKMTL